MASSPPFKVYLGKEYVAAFKYADHAAILCSALGEGTTIHHRHQTLVWTEGVDGDSSESYDNTAAVVQRHLMQRGLS